MPTFWGPAVGSNQLRMDVSWVQSVAGNYSDVTVGLYYVGQWASSANTYVGIAIDGAQAYANTSSQSWGTGTTYLAGATWRVYHNANGTRNVDLAGAINMPYSIGQLGVVANNMTLPTIPRQPSAPTTPWLSAVSHDSMTVEFRHQGSVPATRFELQRATNSSFTQNLVKTNTGIYGTIPVTGLTPGTTYYFRALAYNDAGWSAPSGVLTTYTTPQADTPWADSITATGMRVQFNSVGGGAGSTSWVIQRATNSAFTANLVETSSGGTTVFSDLTPGTTYYYRARGKNASGTGPWSSVISAATLTLLPPSVVVVSDPTGASAQATITPPTGASIDTYTIEGEYLSPLPKPSGADKSVTTAAVTATITGLVPGATYRWRVRANVGTYSTDWSSWTSVTQVNPGTLDSEYFDSTTPSSDPDITRTTATVSGVLVQVENAVTPKHWVAGGNFQSIRRGSTNLVPSEGSTRNARVKVIRPIVPPGDSVALTGNDSMSLISVLPSATHTAKVFVKVTAPVQAQLSISWFTAAGVPTHMTTSEQVTLEAGVLTEMTVRGKSQAGSERATVLLVVRSAPVGTFIDLDGGFLALGRPESYFDGGTADTFRFLHEWEGTQWNSKSLRIPVPAGSAPDPFQDPLCPAPPAAPRPPVPVNECIPKVSIWRRYFSPLDSGAVSAAFDSLPTFTITTGSQPDGPIRVQIFENPDSTSVEEFVPTTPISEQFITYLPAQSEAVLDAVSERAYGRLIGSDDFSGIDHLVFGTAGGPATWPVLGCNMGYMVVLDVPASSPLGNVVLTASLTTRMG